MAIFWSSPALEAVASHASRDIEALPPKRNRERQSRESPAAWPCANTIHLSQCQRNLVQGSRLVRVESFLSRQARREQLRGHDIRYGRQHFGETAGKADHFGRAGPHLTIARICDSHDFGLQSLEFRDRKSVV